MLLNLWSSPRNISTALMYSFAQRRDTTVIDEPLYAHYLLHQPTGAEHPGREEIITSQENDGGVVVEALLRRASSPRIIVAKQMTHHLFTLDEDFKVAVLGEKAAISSRVVNLLLIRDPRRIVASFAKVVDRVTAEDIGIPQQYALFRRLKDAGAPVLVLDARRLLENPEVRLRALCTACDIPFDPAMLEWEAGPRPEDGVWAPHWYGNVHRSTGFQPYVEKDVTLSPGLQEIVDQCTPVYRELLSRSI